MQGKIAELRKRANALHNFTKRLDYQQDCSASDYAELVDIFNYLETYIFGALKEEVEEKKRNQERDLSDETLINAIAVLRSLIEQRRKDGSVIPSEHESSAAECLNNAILNAYASNC